MSYHHNKHLNITTSEEPPLPYYLFFRLRLFLCSIVLLAIWIASRYLPYRNVLKELFTIFA